MLSKSARLRILLLAASLFWRPSDCAAAPASKKDPYAGTGFVKAPLTVMLPIPLLQLDSHYMVAPSTRYRDIPEEYSEAAVDYLKTIATQIVPQTADELVHVAEGQTRISIPTLEQSYNKLADNFHTSILPEALASFKRSEIPFVETLLRATRYVENVISPGQLKKTVRVQDELERFLKRAKKPTLWRDQEIQLAYCRDILSPESAAGRKRELDERLTLLECFDKLCHDGPSSLKVFLQIQSKALDQKYVGNEKDMLILKAGITTENLSYLAKIHKEHGFAASVPLLRYTCLHPDRVLSDDSEVVKKAIQRAEKAKGRELKAAEEKRRKAEEELLAGEKQQPPKKGGKAGGKKERRGKKEPARAEPAEEPAEAEPEEEPETAVVKEAEQEIEYRLTKEGQRLRLHRRVKKWEWSAEDLQRYFDAHHIEKYRNQTLKQIKAQKAVHDLKEAVALLGYPGADNYFFRTDKGVSALAEVQIGDETHSGILEVGIDSERGLVYHLMFKRCELRAEEGPALVSPSFEQSSDSDEEQGEGKFQTKSRCLITRERGMYVLEYTKEEVKRVLRVLPLEDNPLSLE